MSQKQLPEAAFCGSFTQVEKSVLDEDEAIDLDLLHLIPRQIVENKKLFPLKKEKRLFYIAMVDPVDIATLDVLRFLTGLEIQPVEITEKTFGKLFNKYYRFADNESAYQQEKCSAAPEEAVEVAGVDEAPVIQLVNSIITEAIISKASDIHIEPGEKGVRVRYRVDGMLREAHNLPLSLRNTLVARIKVMASMDIAERRLPQDGRIPLRTNEYEADLRISTMPLIFGEKVVIRLFYKDHLHTHTLENLGLSEKSLNLFSNLLQVSHGMLLLTGPTGSGKTTTLYAALNALNNQEKNIATVEDPVEYVIEGINQTQINVKAGATFSTYLRSVLRQDPDIIMVGEIRDRETAEIAVRAAATGHLVLSTLHTNDAAGALLRLIDLGIEPFMVASVVLGVLAQRLVRRICSDCKVKTYLNEPEKVFTGISAINCLFYEGKGCKMCNDTGYCGRLAIDELLAITPELRKLILKGAAAEEIRNEAVRQGMLTLREDGLQKALQGITTVREVMRVL